MKYFDHDTTASSDDLILALRIAHGGAAVDCYWAILEQIYRDEAPTVIIRNRPETQALCARLATAFDTVREWVSTMIEYGLLEASDDGCGGYSEVVSERAMENIKGYQEMCERNRLNGQKGGRKPKRKPSGNRAGTEPLPSGGEKKRKEKKALGSYEKNPKACAARSAEAGEPAPRTAHRCPECGAEMRITATMQAGTGRRFWRCDECGKEAVYG